MENILNSLLDSGLINDYLHAEDLKYLKKLFIFITFSWFISLRKSFIIRTCYC